MTGWTNLPWLHRTTAPTLVLSGANDPVVPPANARILGARIPNASVHVVPDTRHLLLMERAAECAAFITQFLRPDVSPRTQIMGHSATETSGAH